MLTPEEFKEISAKAGKIYSDLELEIISEIASRIANVGYINSVAENDIKIAQEMGILYQDVISLVAKYNNNSYKKIQTIFEEAGIKTLKFDDTIYSSFGLKGLPLHKSKTMLQFLYATIKKTNKNLNNLVMTTANTSQIDFFNAMNQAYMEVGSGVKSYSQSIIDAIKNISSKSGTVQYPSGYKTSIENAVRKNIVTGVNQTCGELQLMRANELNWDLMEISAHAGARPSHAEWQGKVVSLSGKIGYLSLSDIGYGDAGGFKGINCSHDWYPYKKGMKRIYHNSELKKIENKTVIYKGKRLNQYDAAQIQRKIERNIRQDKKDMIGLESILRSNNIGNELLQSTRKELEDKKIQYRNNISKLNDFLKQTGLKKDNTRLIVKN